MRAVQFCIEAVCNRLEVVLVMYSGIQLTFLRPFVCNGLEYLQEERSSPIHGTHPPLLQGSAASCYNTVVSGTTDNIHQ